MMRFALILICLESVAACKSVPPPLVATGLPELDFYQAPSCQKPSVQFRELRDAQSHKVSTKNLPTQVPSGVYSIGLSCGSVFDAEQNACVVPKNHSAKYDVSAYDLVLKPSARYSFSCALVRGEWTPRMTESTL
jgi:hypothetical protein